MATRDYFAVFGSGNPSSKTGLAPTFITFVTTTGAAATPPSISEPGSKGIYKWSFDASATLIVFTLDGATTGLATSDRYISGVLEGQDAFGVTLNAIGNTQLAFGNSLVALGMTNVALGITSVAQGTTAIAIGTTLTAIGLSGSIFSFIGSTASTFGSTGADPVDLFGFLKRMQEWNEGNQTYTKASGILDFYSRGSSTLLREKTVSDSAASTTKI